MKKLLILTRFPNEYEPKRLAEAARERGIKAEIVNYQDIGETTRIGEIDYLIPRSSAHRNKKSLVRLKTRILEQLPPKVICLNKKTFLKWPLLGKIKQAQILSQHDLPTIPSLAKPEFPLILKAEFGSHSKRVFRVDNKKDLDKARQTGAGKWILQPLVKSPVYWRVLVLGGRALGIMERRTSKRFYQGKETGRVDEEEMMNLAEKASRVFDSDFAGVDILVDGQGKFLIIEVNRSPQFQIFERKTEVDVAGAVLEYFLSPTRD